MRHLVVPFVLLAFLTSCTTVSRLSGDNDGSAGEMSSAVIPVPRKGIYRNKSGDMIWNVTPVMSGGSLSSLTITQSRYTNSPSDTLSYTCSLQLCTYGNRTILIDTSEILNFSVDGVYNDYFRYSN